MEFCESHMKLVEKIQEIDSRCKSNQHRINDVEAEIKEIKSDNKILHEMNKNIAVLATSLDSTSKKVSKIESDVEELKSKPSKKWDSVTLAVITTIIGGIIGVILGKILGG